MGYRVHNDGDKFKIVEVVEGEVRTISSGLENANARAIAKKLNTGGGFDCWTPNFFLTSAKLAV